MSFTYSALPKPVQAVIKMILLLVLTWSVLWGAFKMAYPSGTWRYKMTVTVETPEGEKSGSAVREVYVHKVPKFLPEVGSTKILTGEAVVVDLGNRGQVFALLDGVDLVYKAFPFKGGYTSREGIRHYRSLKTGHATLTPNDYPKFVRFRDINDPKTVENLLEMKECDEKKPHPKKYCIAEDRFEEAFGQGVKLKSVTIEMTEEKVTWGKIDKYITGYRPIEQYMDWIRTLKYGDPRRIGPDSFKKG